MSAYPRVSLSASTQSRFHSDPVDADDFDQSANAGSPGDVSVFRCQFHRGFTSETQRRLDPRLFRVVVMGSLRMAFYDDECVSIDIIGPIDDCQADAEPWFADLVKQYSGKVAL